MTVLQEIIDGSTDDAVSTSNLLRKVQIAAHRLGAVAITAWVSHELNGYPTIDSLPKYRKLNTPVMGTWTGYGGAKAVLPLGPGNIPKQAEEVLFHTKISDSIAALEELAQLKGDPVVSWEPQHVVAYNGWVDEGLVSGMEMMGLIAANRMVTKAAIRGIIDAARNTALDFALQLQTTDPAAGNIGGPTVQDAPIAATIYNITNNITGHGTNIAAGHRANQASTVTVNDLASLLAAAKELGLDDDAANELAAAVVASKAERPSKVASFLAKVAAGTFAIGSSATGQLVADQLTPLINAYLGI